MEVWYLSDPAFTPVATVTPAIANYVDVIAEMFGAA